MYGMGSHKNSLCSVGRSQNRLHLDYRSKVPLCPHFPRIISMCLTYQVQGYMGHCTSHRGRKHLSRCHGISYVLTQRGRGANDRSRYRNEQMSSAVQTIVNHGVDAIKLSQMSKQMTGNYCTNNRTINSHHSYKLYLYSNVKYLIIE